MRAAVPTDEDPDDLPDKRQKVQANEGTSEGGDIEPSAVQEQAAAATTAATTAPDPKFISKLLLGLKTDTQRNYLCLVLSQKQGAPVPTGLTWDDGTPGFGSDPDFATSYIRLLWRSYAVVLTEARYSKVDTSRVMGPIVTASGDDLIQNIGLDPVLTGSSSGQYAKTKEGKGGCSAVNGLKYWAIQGTGATAPRLHVGKSLPPSLKPTAPVPVVSVHVAPHPQEPPPTV